MSKRVRNLLIAGAIVLVLSAAFGFTEAYLEARTGRDADFGMARWFFPTLVAIAVYASLEGLAGNRKVAMADSAERDRTLSFTPEAGRSLLVIVREGFVGKAVGVNVQVDGANVAQLKSPRFTAVSVPPGVHQLSADSRSGSGGLKAEPLELRTEAGETVVLKLVMTMGLTKNTLKFERQSDLETVRGKLRSVPMVAPEAPAAF